MGLKTVDKSEVERIVNANLRAVRERWHLDDWRITVEFGPCPDERVAGVTFDINYRCAKIRLDPEYCTDEAAVLEYLQHECIHLVLAPIEFYVDILERQGTSGFSEAAAKELWEFAIEQTVGNLERASGPFVPNKLEAGDGPA